MMQVEVYVDVLIHVAPGISDIVLENRDEDQGGDAGGEASVI